MSPRLWIKTVSLFQLLLWWAFVLGVVALPVFGLANN